MMELLPARPGECSGALHTVRDMSELFSRDQSLAEVLAVVKDRIDVGIRAGKNYRSSSSQAAVKLSG
jgi:hypothetical protein